MKQLTFVLPQLAVLNDNAFGDGRPSDVQYIRVDPSSFQSDDIRHMTIKKAEAEFVGFDFRGPGWYQLKHYTLLVVPAMGGVSANWLMPIGAEPSEQEWCFYVYPARRGNGRYLPMEAIKYLATLDWRQCEKQYPPGALIDEETKEQMPYNPIEITLPPGGAIRVLLKDTDGQFDISFDYGGNKKVVVTTDMGGNVMGCDGPIYVEDMSVDADGIWDKDDLITVPPPSPAPRIDTTQAAVAKADRAEEALERTHPMPKSPMSGTKPAKAASAPKASPKKGHSGR